VTVDQGEVGIPTVTGEHATARCRPNVISMDRVGKQRFDLRDVIIDSVGG
jgi:hypothetical protein